MRYKYRTTLALVALAAILPYNARAETRPACGGITVVTASTDYRAWVCAFLEGLPPGDRTVIDTVFITEADGAGMLMPTNPETPDNSINCGEAPRGLRHITIRDHPRCGVLFALEWLIAHELGHKRWEALHPGEAYGPRWEEEEAYANGYADAAAGLR